VTCVYVAAGGGGDALGAAIVHRSLGHDEPAVIATYAWDRLWIDPLPGPRGVADFRGLRPIGERNFAITPTTEPVPPSGSTLPRLAADLADTLVLLDPYAGAVGMRAQLSELAHLFEPHTLTVLDVGGDAVARGDEPGLRSPLADGLAVAAATHLHLDVNVIVAGPGLDGELTEGQVLAVTGANPSGHVDATTVERFRRTLSWHPSEATALLAAAARGLRGRVEIRDSGLAVDLTDHSSEAFLLALSDLVDVNALAPALAATSSLDEAEEVAREIFGLSEIDYERAKADRIRAGRSMQAPTDLDDLVDAFERDAAARGIDFVTFRRIAEATGMRPADAVNLVTYLTAARPDHDAWPLWSIAPVTVNTHTEPGTSIHVHRVR
jgi:hypothetical protein